MNESVQWVIVALAVLSSVLWLLRQRLPWIRQADQSRCDSSANRSQCGSCHACPKAMYTATRSRH